MDTDVQRQQFHDLIDDAVLMGVSPDNLRAILLREQQRAQGIIRISALPAAFACPSSRLPVKHPYNPSSDMANLGTAAHAALATVVTGQVPDIDALAKQHHVDADELAYLVSAGTTAWHDIGLDSENSRAEYRLHGRGIAGTADVVHHDGVRATIVDWKTNRVKRTYRPQLVGYAAALCDEFVPPESKQVQVITVWLRFGEFETATVTLDDIERFYRDLETAKLEIGESYAPGDACTYCPRQLVCEARHDYLRSASAALMAAQHVKLELTTLSSLYQQSKQVSKALEHYKSALTMALREQSLPDGKGNMLELTTMERDRIDPMEAWNVIKSFGVSDEDLAQCVTMSKQKVMRVVGKDLPRGEKGAARGAFWAAMNEAGAVKKRISETIKIQEAE